MSIARKLPIACKRGKLLASQFVVNLLNLPWEAIVIAGAALAKKASYMGITLQWPTV